MKSWAIGLMHANQIDLKTGEVKSKAIRWVHAPSRSEIYADPFIVTEGEQIYLLAEHLRFRENRGEIIACKNLIDDHPKFETILKQNHHLSFPSLFREGNRFLFVPEQASGSSPTLYEWDRTHGRAIKIRTLIENIAAIDPVLFFHNDRWWLFFTSGRDSSRTTLECWHAENLESEFVPHRLNPLKKDIHAGRAAGRPFYDEGRLLRPTQNGANQYGGSISLFRIDALSPDEFKETFFSEIRPFDPHYKDGLHQISIAPPWLVIDGCKNQFYLFASIFRALSWLRSRFSF
jgi:hypothetical protein